MRKLVKEEELASSSSLFLAGDTMISRPWSDQTDASFLHLVEKMRAADVGIVNLETLFHKYGGYAQAASGGTYVAAPPAVAPDVAWIGRVRLAQRVSGGRLRRRLRISFLLVRLAWSAVVFSSLMRYGGLLAAMRRRRQS
jgi:hypothetical protein